ncbi:protein mitoshell [Culex pipiens pallens]|uniref:protein mitoshell n=1 Tax=Culex pipiens pallens TaxID=42434 RepID=UPI0019547069|nr:protein mitoshell [Culex pipiens pallens]
MADENFNKAPGSEIKNRIPPVSLGNGKTSSLITSSSPLLPGGHQPSTASSGHSALSQDFQYTILQYGHHLMPTLVQPGFSVYHPAPPPPPVPMSFPVFYQPVNGGLPQPQPVDANMFYRCMPQLASGAELLGGQKLYMARGGGTKVAHGKNKSKELDIDTRKIAEIAVGVSDAPLSPLLSPDSTSRGAASETGFGGTGAVADQEKFAALTEMAMQGCELAEQLATHHQKRPCFKKIDSLCARMKQDLIRPDSVLANINSQGIAWAVKDFIFVFTRIINAWIIIKGYVYNTPEGLERVQKVLSPDFLESFSKWQDSTIDFVDCLIKSFTNLDQMVQTQRTSGVQKESKYGGGRQSKTDEEKERHIHELYEYLKDMIPNLGEGGKGAAGATTTSSSDNTSTSDMSDRSSVVFENAKSFLMSVVNDSTHAQMKHNENGTYFKTGIYEPVKKPPGFGSPPPQVSCQVKSSYPLAEPSPVTSTPKILKNPIAQDRPDLLGSVAGADGDGGDISLGGQLQTDFFNDAIIRKSFDSETVAKIHFLLQKVFSVKEAMYFLVGQFTKNYFPDFHTINPNFVDLRSIISKAQIGGYRNVYEIVQDLRQIVVAARRYLEQKSNTLLEESADEFERSLEDILSDKIFDCYDFSGSLGSSSPTATSYSGSSSGFGSSLAASSGGF